MRYGFLTATVFLGAAAHASFDLMLVGHNETGNVRSVYRWDPQNSVALGRFGQNFINDEIMDVATDSATGRCFVLQQDGDVRVFNYHTGAYQYRFAVSSNYDTISYDTTSNGLFLGPGGWPGLAATRLVNSTSGSLLAQYSGATLGSGAVRRGTGTNVLAWGIGSNGNLAAYQFGAGGGSPTAQAETTNTANSTTLFTHALYSGTSLYGLSYGGQTTNLWRVNTTSSGISGTPAEMTILGNGGLGVDLANGHGETIYAMVGHRIFSISNTDHSVIGSHYLPFGSFSTTRGMAVVLAPEPAEWAILGVGIGGLVLRRKRVKRGSASTS